MMDHSELFDDFQTLKIWVVPNSIPKASSWVEDCSTFLRFTLVISLFHVGSYDTPLHIELDIWMMDKCVDLNVIPNAWEINPRLVNI